MSFQQAALALVSSTMLVLVPLRAQVPPDAQTPAIKKSELQKKNLGGMLPMHALGDVYLAGQPTPADLAIFKQQGIKTVFTLRKAHEIPWDEAAAVKQLDMKFVRVPFQQPAELKPQVFDEVLKMLRDKKRGPTVLHCGSANRVGAIWYAHRILDGKLSPEAALKEAKVVGLRTPALLERAKAYVEQAKNQPAKVERQTPEAIR